LPLAALDGVASQLFHTAGACLADLSADDRAVVLAHHANTDTATVSRRALTGGTAQDLGVAYSSTAAGSGARAAETTAVAGGHVYFRQLGPQNVSQVTRVGSDGQGAIGALRRTATDLAADGERMFWSEGGGVFTALPQPPLGTTPPAGFVPAWANRYEEPQTQNRFHYMKLLPDGAIAVLGHSVGGLNGERAVLYKLRADGTRDFTEEFTIQGGTQPACLAVDGGGTISAAVDEFFAGSLAIHRFSSTGAELPTIREPSVGSGTAECTADAAGNLYLALGGSLFVKKNASGTDIWREGSATAGSLSPSELTAVSEGVIFVGQLHGSIDLGGTRHAGGDASSILAKLAANGGFAWSKLIQGGVLHGVAADSAGQLVAVGETPEKHELVRSHNLSRHLLPAAPDGFYLLQ
jgi:hypothetical protein